MVGYRISDIRDRGSEIGHLASEIGGRLWAL
jgi:hypothetical protein